MTTSVHLYSGALIGLAVTQPAIALPLALLSHFALDAVPHYWYPGEGFGQIFRHRLTYVMEAADILGILLFAYLMADAGGWVWAAAIAATLPDAGWVYRYLRYERAGGRAPEGLYSRFHKWLQWGERPWGIAVEIPLLAGLAALAWRLV